MGIAQGVLNETYLDWMACKGTPWDDFRSRYAPHIEDGQWNWADDHAWSAKLENWQLIKSAEFRLEAWRTAQLQPAEYMNYTDALKETEESGGYRRDTSSGPISVLGVTDVTMM